MKSDFGLNQFLSNLLRAISMQFMLSNITIGLRETISLMSFFLNYVEFDAIEHMNLLKHDNFDNLAPLIAS